MKKSATDGSCLHRKKSAYGKSLCFFTLCKSGKSMLRKPLYIAHVPVSCEYLQLSSVSVFSDLWKSPSL